MGFHKCDKANKCPYGSETEPGRCGFMSCRIKAKEEYKHEIHPLHKYI